MFENDVKVEECRKILKRIAWRIQYRERKRFNKEAMMIEEVFGTEQMESVTSQLFIKQLFDSISSEQGRFIIRKVVIDGWTEKEVAKHLNITQQAVNKCKKKYLGMLRQTTKLSV